MLLGCKNKNCYVFLYIPVELFCFTRAIADLSFFLNIQLTTVTINDHRVSYIISNINVILYVI